jgi:hypothetical protein
MQLRLIQAEIRMDPGAAEARVTSASSELSESLGELRELLRGIHPAVLEYGLSTALEALAGRSPVPTAASWDVSDRLPRRGRGGCGGRVRAARPRPTGSRRLAATCSSRAPRVRERS